MVCQTKQFSKSLSATSAPFYPDFRFTGSLAPGHITPFMPQLGESSFGDRSIELPKQNSACASGPYNTLFNLSEDDFEEELIKSCLPDGLFAESETPKPNPASSSSPSACPYPKESEAEINISEVTNEEFQYICDLATKIREQRVEERNWQACDFNIKEIWRSCSAELVKKMRACIVTVGQDSFAKGDSFFYGIPFNYHVVLLLRMDGVWHVVDPLMGTNISESDVIKKQQELDSPGTVKVSSGILELPRLPIQMKAADWLLKVFDKKSIAENLYDPRSLYKMRFLNQVELDKFATPPLETLYRDKLIDPLMYKEKGENTVNLSQMIDLFQEVKTMASVLAESKSKTAEQVALAVDEPKINSYFNL